MPHSNMPEIIERMRLYDLRYLILFTIFLAVLARNAPAQTAPETTIISGPNNLTLAYEDVTFWWIGTGYGAKDVDSTVLLSEAVVSALRFAEQGWIGGMSAGRGG